MRNIVSFIVCSAIAAATTLASPVRDNLAARSLSDSTVENIVHVECLESTGSQYIDTGIVLSSDCRVVCDWEWVSSPYGSSSSYPFGIYGGGANFGVNVDTKGDEYCVWASASTKTGSGFRNQRHTVDLSSAGLFVDGVQVFMPAGAFFGMKSAYLFWANGTKQGKAVVKIWSCQIYNNDVLVGSFVPVRIGSEGMMLDLVSGELFRNQGSGAFVVGPDVD